MVRGSRDESEKLVLSAGLGHETSALHATPAPS
jgi:hypothetical protein